MLKRLEELSEVVAMGFFCNDVLRVLKEIQERTDKLKEYEERHPVEYFFAKRIVYYSEGL